MRGLESKTDVARKTQLLLDQLGLDLAVQVDGRLLLERLLVLCLCRSGCVYLVLGVREGSCRVGRKPKKTWGKTNKEGQRAALVSGVQCGTYLGGRLEAQAHVTVVPELATPPRRILFADDRNGRLHLETTLSLVLIQINSFIFIY